MLRGDRVVLRQVREDQDVELWSILRDEVVGSPWTRPPS